MRGMSGSDKRRLRLLMASSSLAAVLAGGGAPSAWAAPCKITQNGGTIGLVSNSSATGNCILVENGASVTGNVTNTSAGVLTTNGAATPSRTGITINNSTVSGTVSNAGQITASKTGIIVTNNATVSGGIVNGGVISAGGSGILVTAVSTFAGGVTNSGTITAGLLGIDLKGTNVVSIPDISGNLVNSGAIISVRTGMAVSFVSTFTGDVVNAGTIRAGDTGMFVASVSTFIGGMTNSGTIVSTHESGMYAFGVSVFSGGMTNSGTISAANWGMYAQSVAGFSGGMTNSGTITAGFQGISVVDDATFSGTVSNAGVISAGANGINVTHVTQFGSSSAGGIVNSGAITAAGTGILVTAVSTFAGGVTNSGTITAGLLGIDLKGTNVVSIPDISGNLVNSGAIISVRTGMAVSFVSTFTGDVINTGTIRAGDSGMFVASVSTFVGGMTNSGAIISTHESGMYAFGVSVFSGGMTNSGTISAANWGMYAQSVSDFSGGMTNSGTITAGAHGLAVVSVPTFTGGITNTGTILAAGTGIYVDSVSTLAGGITNTGTVSGAHGIFAFVSTSVSLFDSGTIIGTSGNAITFGTGPNTLTLGPGFNIQGDVVGSGTDILQLGGTGSGNFNLSTIGPGLQYLGFTTFNVVGGVWNTTGTFGQSQAWNVNGGTLAGTGIFQSVNVNNGGTLEPGTPGTAGGAMTINGNLTFQSGAAYLVNLSPTTASRANVSGAVTLNGAAAQGFLTPGAYNKSMTYDILDPTSISGTFSGFTAVNAPGFAGTLTYNDNTDVLLNLTAQLGAGGGLNQNQRNVATTINTAFNNGATLPAGFFPVFGLSGGALGNALSQLDGEDATGAERGAFDLMNQFLTLMLDPFVDGRVGSSTNGALGFAPDQQQSLPPDVALAYAGLLKAPPPQTFNQRWSTWASGFGGSALSNGDPAIGSNNVTTSAYGYAAGVDYHYSPDTVLGFSLAGGGTNWTLANALGTGRSDALLAGIYGVTHDGPWYLGGAVAFANNWFTTNRTAMGDQLTASFQGQSYSARLEGGYRLAAPVNHGAVGVTPYAALQVQDFQTPSYSETDLTGGGLGLAYNAMSGTDTRSELGSRFDDLTALNNMPLILRAKVAWAHDWVSNPALNASFESLPAASFTVNGAQIPHDSALTSAGAQLFFTPNWSFLAKFDGEFAGGYQLYAGSGTLRYTW
jgi:uncharacterized protein with beta-barrel porin domain